MAHMGGCYVFELEHSVATGICRCLCGLVVTHQPLSVSRSSAVNVMTAQARDPRFYFWQVSFHFSILSHISPLNTHF